MIKSVVKIFQQVLVNHFYQVNTGFFLFCFFILFGVITPGQLISYHLSLIHGMIQSYVFLGCVIMLWTLYAAKCINQVTQQLLEPRQQFLFVINRLSPRTQWCHLFIVHLQVYAPVGLYALIVAGVAVKNGYWASMLIVSIANLLLVTLPVFLYRKTLQKKNITLWLIPPGIDFIVRKPLALVPIWFIWKNKKQMVVITKLFTFFMLYLFIQLNERDNSDLRPLYLILLLIGIAHCAIIFQLRAFEEEYLLFTRNLPLSNIQRFAALLIAILCMLLPELLFIWKGYPAQFALADYLPLVAFTVSLPVLFYCMLLVKEMDMDSYLRAVFGVCAALFLIIFYSPGISLTVSLLLLSFVFFTAHFNTFEKRSAVHP